MAKKFQTPGEALKSYLDKYQINVFFLSKQLGVNNLSVLRVLRDEGKITTRLAFCFAKYFKTTPKFWLDIQLSSDITKVKNDMEFLSFLENLPVAEKPRGKRKAAGKDSN